MADVICARRPGYDRSAMATRSRARFLAPLALVITIAGTYYVIEQSTRHDHARRPGHQVGSGARGATGGSILPSRPAAARPAYYLVRPGDTLSAIALREHVSLTTLEALNPSVSPGALQTGQRLRLRR